MNKLIGGILLIVGTSIGAGMLALPVTTAPGGFIGASILLLFCWLLMTFSALLILEVNLWLPRDSNIISMAKSTLGRAGEVIAWITYLLLLYSLIAAYISGGSDILHGIFTTSFHWTISQSWSAAIFLLVLGFVVYHGIKPIDYVNRFLMTAKLLAFFILIVLILPHMSLTSLTTLHTKALIPAITVVITSFGFANIIPSLRSYYDDDIKKLRKAIIIGSLIPLFCYMIWIAVILGDVPTTGLHGLFEMLNASDPTSSLLQSLNIYLANTWINEFAHLFTSICVATSFLGVSLSMTDFLADGLNMPKQGKNKVIINALTFIPPLVLVIFYPAAFIACLSYAGIFCVILLIILPILMVWRGRYIKHISEKYRVFGGKYSLVIAILAAIFIIIQNIRLM